MMTAKRVEVQVALLPLLHRDFQVRSLALIEPTIALETDAKGVGNWDFSRCACGRAQTPRHPMVRRRWADFSSATSSISNGTLTYRDGESGKLTTVTIANFALKARDPQSPVERTLSRQRRRHRRLRSMATSDR